MGRETQALVKQFKKFLLALIFGSPTTVFSKLPKVRMLHPQRNMHTQNGYKGEDHDIQEKVINIPIRFFIKSKAQSSILS